MSRLGTSDAEAVAEVKALKRRLLAQRKQLRAERKRRAKNTAALRAQKDPPSDTAGVQGGRVQARQGRTERLARAGGLLPPGVSATPGANGMVFPVQGSYYYSNTWGASRSGGRRRHQGTDIMARRGTPVVAVSSGSVTSKSGGSAAGPSG